MYTDMEMWNDIRRRVLVEGESKRSIQREYGIHWKTLKKILDHSEPPGYRMSRPRRKRKIGPYLPIIEQILEDDKKRHKKQHHTAKRIFDRLRAEHGFDGGYTIVKDAVRELRLSDKEVYVPLEHKPGEAKIEYFGCVYRRISYDNSKIAVKKITGAHRGELFEEDK